MRNEAFPLQPVRVSYKSRVIVLAQMHDQGNGLPNGKPEYSISFTQGKERKENPYTIAFVLKPLICNQPEGRIHIWDCNLVQSSAKGCGPLVDWLGQSSNLQASFVTQLSLWPWNLAGTQKQPLCILLSPVPYQPRLPSLVSVHLKLLMEEKVNLKVYLHHKLFMVKRHSGLLAQETAMWQFVFCCLFVCF